MNQIIDLRKDFFKKDPLTEFCYQYGIKRRVLNKCLEYYNLNDLPLTETVAMLNYKTGQDITRKTLYRWLLKYQLYIKAQKLIKMGYESINVVHFKPESNGEFDLSSLALKVALCPNPSVFLDTQ